MPHFHVHVLPCWPDDGVGLSWPRKEPPLAEVVGLAGRIRVT